MKEKEPVAGFLYAAEACRLFGSLWKDSGDKISLELFALSSAIVKASKLTATSSQEPRLVMGLLTCLPPLTSPLVNKESPA